MDATGESLAKELIPEGCIPLGIMAVATYIDGDAEHAYSFYFDVDDASLMTHVGFLEALKQQLLSTLMGGSEDG